MGYSAQVGMGDGILSTAYDYWAAVYAGDRNLDGTYTEQGKAKLIEQQVLGLIKASGGTMTPEQAREILRGDITNVLKDANADPSQTGHIFPDFNSILKWGAVGLGAVLLILIVKD